MARTTPRPVHVTDKAYMTQVHSYKLALNQNIGLIWNVKCMFLLSLVHIVFIFMALGDPIFKKGRNGIPLTRLPAQLVWFMMLK
jgi:hypothetical protein